MICTAATSGLVCSIFSTGKSALYTLQGYSTDLVLHIKLRDSQQTD